MLLDVCAVRRHVIVDLAGGLEGVKIPPFDIKDLLKEVRVEVGGRSTVENACRGAMEQHEATQRWHDTIRFWANHMIINHVVELIK